MERHDAEAARRMPGPDYRAVLGWLHEELAPLVYVEIGVLHGDTLRLAGAETVAVGVDPAPRIELALPPNARLWPMTSTEFFRRGELGGLGAVGLAFVDGLHLFEQTLRDVCGLAGHMAPGGVIALHDTIPLNAETSTRARRTEFHTGDVWKAVVYLQARCPGLQLVTLPAAPSGLTLVRGFEGPMELDEEGLRAVADLEWEYFAEHHREFLNLVPLERHRIQVFRQ